MGSKLNNVKLNPRVERHASDSEYYLGTCHTEGRMCNKYSAMAYKSRDLNRFPANYFPSLILSIKWKIIKTISLPKNEIGF